MTDGQTLLREQRRALTISAVARKNRLSMTYLTSKFKRRQQRAAAGKLEIMPNRTIAYCRLAGCGNSSRRRPGETSSS